MTADALNPVHGGIWAPAAVRRRRAGIALGLAVACLLPQLALAEAPVVPLPEELRKQLSLLGKGAVGKALPARPIDDPAKLRHLAAGTWTYRIVAGPKKGQDERVQIARVDSSHSGAGWRVETGDEDIQTLVVTTDNEVMKLSQTDLASDRIVVYRPGLVLDSGMKVGESKSVDRKIETYKVKKPKEIEFHGTLHYTTRYIGAYRVHTPAGAFDTRLLEHAYEMKIGPAMAKNLSWDFYADGVGNVAEVSHESVKAVLVYRRSSKRARLLLKFPKN